MSKKYQEILRISEDVAGFLRRTPVMFSSGTLSSTDTWKIRDAIVLWTAAYYDMANHYQFTCNWKRWLTAITSVPFDLLIKGLKEADELILQYCEIGFPDSYASLKQTLKSQDFKHCLALLGELKVLIAAFYIDNDANVLRDLRSLLLFCSKLNVTLDALKEEGLEEYLQTERNLQTEGFTREERDLLRRSFPSDDRYEFESRIVPHHGNGSTADGALSLEEKYASLKTDALLEYWRRDWSDGLITVTNSSPLQRRARLAFVPKSLSKYRTISMEPPTMMYWQEGVLDAFNSMCRDRWRWFRRYYAADTQEPNRRAAQLGSIDGKFSTIDLSAASDSVTWALIRAWFPGTALYRSLAATRSTEVLLTDGSVLKLKKFAPMGSAVNFPVEVLVFWACTTCAISAAGGDPVRTPYWVYGDDIVVPTRYYDAVVERLTRNGFKVNSTKSFHYGYRGYFRESCGLHAYNGVDVTPMILSRKFTSFNKKRLSAQDISAMIDLCNRFETHFRSVRYLLIKRLLKLPAALQPLFGDEGIHSSHATNHHLRWLWHEGLQTYAVRCLRTRVCYARPAESDEYRLYEFLRRTDGRAVVEQPCLVNTSKVRDVKAVPGLALVQQDIEAASFPTRTYNLYQAL